MAAKVAGTVGVAGLEYAIGAGMLGAGLGARAVGGRGAGSQGLPQATPGHSPEYYARSAAEARLAQVVRRIDEAVGTNQAAPWEHSSIPADYTAETRERTMRQNQERSADSATEYLLATRYGGEVKSGSRAEAAIKARNVSYGGTPSQRATRSEFKSQGFRPYGPQEIDAMSAEDLTNYVSDYINRERENAPSEDEKVLVMAAFADEQLSERFFNAAASPAQHLMREAMRDAGSANEVVYTPTTFARALARSRASMTWANNAMRAVYDRYGDNANAQAIFRRVVVNKLIPALVGSGVTFVAKKIANEIYAVDREKKGGKVEITQDTFDRDVLDREISEAEKAVDVGVTGENPSFYQKISKRQEVDPRGLFLPLSGSVANTPGADLPLGPLDDLIPKSAPIYPSAPPDPDSRLPGMSIFDDRLRGDTLSERAGNPHALVTRSRISVPETIEYVPPTQYYSSMPHRPSPMEQPQVPPPQQSMKRKAISEPTHMQRNMEFQIPQNFDPQYVPAFPSSVNANTSVQWKEYTGANQGFHVPLDDAPNLVGIGFDAQTVERQFAQQSFKPPEKNENVPMGIDAKQDNMSSPHDIAPAVNAANVTNPVFKNAQKPPPEGSAHGPSLNLNSPAP